MNWKLSAHICNQIRFILPTDLDGVLFKGIISPKQLKIDEPEIFESFDFNKIAISSSLLSFENKKVKINE